MAALGSGLRPERQARSLFKLFVNLTAFGAGFSAEAILVDRPSQIGDWEPQNAKNRFPGAVPLRTAFASSINTIAAQLADEVGIPAVTQTARQLGVQSDLPAVPSLALGSAEVTLVEMTRAYASVFANRMPLETYSIRSISGDAGTSLDARAAPKAAAPLPGDSRAMMLESRRPWSTMAPARARASAVSRSPARPARRRTTATPGSSESHRPSWSASGPATTTTAR